MANLSEKTLISYKSTINSIHKHVGLGPTAPNDSASWIDKNLSGIMKMIDETESKHTAKNRVVILKIWADMFGLPEKIIGVLDKKMYSLVDEVNGSYASNKMNEKVAENWKSIDEIRERVEVLKNKLPEPKYIDTYKEYVQLMRYLCLLFHTYMPLRNDLADARLMEEMPDDEDVDGNSNYIIINRKSNKGVLHLLAYKTRKEYGSKILEIPSDVVREIVKYWNVIKHFSYDKEAWFITKDGVSAPISRVSYTKMLNSAFAGDGVKVSSTQIRRAVVTDLYAPTEDEYKKKQDLANVMGHAASTAALIYAKVVPPKKEKK
jgi:integrase